MNVKQLRFLPALAAIAAAFGGSAIAAGAVPHYCDPLAGCGRHFVKVSPRTVKAGNRITVSGEVGNRCKKPNRVTIYSRAFKGAARHKVASVPAVFARANRTGKFSKRITIKTTMRPGRYRVRARCRSASIGSTALAIKSR